MATPTDDEKAKADAEAAAKAKAQEQEAAEAAARKAAEDAARPLDETVPGGRYIVNGLTVDANGNPISDGN